MNNQTFDLEVKQGKLIIPAEIEDYLINCPDNVKVSLTIQSESKLTTNLANPWNQWFEEVEKIEATSSNENIDDYNQLLIDKYKKQGLEL
jgi:hypothetical protein